MTTRMTTDVAPEGFEDLIALMALIRPGPMEMAPDYIARKHGRLAIDYMHPELEPILSETYGSRALSGTDHADRQRARGLLDG